MRLTLHHLACSLALLANCALCPLTLAEPGPDLSGMRNHDGMNHTQIALDQVDALLPGKFAAVATSVSAEINIALHQAKQRAEANLCAGQWIPQGTKAAEIGPLLVNSDASVGDHQGSWFYSSLRQPAEFNCRNVSRVNFFQEVSRYLPAWIMIRPAGHGSAFRQGVALDGEARAVIAAR